MRQERHKFPNELLIPLSFYNDDNFFWEEKIPCVLKHVISPTYMIAAPHTLGILLQGKGDTSGGCRCMADGRTKCHPLCNYCH